MALDEHTIGEKYFLIRMHMETLNIYNSKTRSNILLSYDCISHITIDKYVLSFHTNKKERFITLGSIKRCLTMLPPFFLCLRRNLIVNMTYVTSYNLKDSTVTMNDGLILMVSPTKRQMIKKYYASARV